MELLKHDKNEFFSISNSDAIFVEFLNFFLFLIRTFYRLEGLRASDMLSDRHTIIILMINMCEERVEEENLTRVILSEKKKAFCDAVFRASNRF